MKMWDTWFWDEMDKIKPYEPTPKPDKEPKEEDKPKKCIACFFSPCRCASGHNDRIKKL